MPSAFQRLKESIAWRTFPWANLVVEIEPHCQLVLRNRGDFIILREIFITQVYADFLQACGPVRRWVDIGCNCGMFSLYLDRFARTRHWPDRTEALLIDANREAIAAATEALDRSAIAFQSRFVHGAIAKKGQSQVAFYEGKTTHKSSLQSLGSRGRRRVCPVVDLDAQAAQLHGNIDLIKIDIEGGEIHLLDHWTRFLQKARALIFEWHQPHLSLAQLDEQLQKLGFAWTLGQEGRNKEELAQGETGTGLWMRP